ncbi:protein-disulfide reductase DsbD N-terminal domain-containing protein [Rhodanobacter sp. B2A1Ga4]|uniref:protein-disulfide reductase DsbD N-terminal domain-containing protein n=1 Tax=Rhodanobacter sp. B2A1Ga4 TaxID=2778647 RepID=UPI001B36F9BB|nr:protein-disulfide reductase DsbD N-terminal domain-containing protein [Rhodanobacter sp. B2A1Ga4]MBQ4855744.1 protein-disulfide reductase DsbD N-terminal domain-containing protein [Rhodanobacter sp. B2A1Ga4]
MKRCLFHLTFLLLATFGVCAYAQDLLAPEQAFQISAVRESPGRVVLTWSIAPGYAIYRDRVKVVPSDDQVRIGELSLPAGYMADDPSLNLGTVYEGRFVMSVPYALAEGATSPALQVEVGGCHHTDPLVCFPPYRVTVPIRQMASVTP